MKTDLRKKKKTDLKIFFKFLKKVGKRKTMENVRKHKYQACNN